MAHLRFVGVMLCLLYGLMMAAQDGTAFQLAQQEVVLLRNENAILPLKNLDSLRIGHLHFGRTDSTFEEVLRYYTDIQQIGPTLDWTAALKVPTEPPYNFLIFSIETQSAGTPANIARIMEEISTLDVPKVIVVLGEISALDVIQPEALLFSASNTYWTQSLAAQIIFGGSGAIGKLHQNIPPYQIGSGLTTASNFRLGYAPPAVVGMNEQLLTNSLDALLAEGIEAQAFPGATVMVIKDSKVVFQKAYGYHTYERLHETRLDDVFDYASVTKTTAGLPALMKLYGEGKLDLDAPLKQFLPEFEKTNKADLTLRQMLAHNARLTPFIAFWRNTIKENGNFKRRTFRQDSSAHYSIRITDSLWLHRAYKKKMYKAIGESNLNEKPGFVYSDLFFTILPDIVSRQVDADFEPWLKTTFYEPLGATTITFNPTLHFPQERIVPTELDTFFRKQLVHGTVHDEAAAMLGGISSHAGLFSTIGDLAKLAQLYLNGGIYGGERFISEAALQEFTRCQYCAEGNHRGLGFDKPLIQYEASQSYVAKSASPESFGHSGFTGTFYWIDPAQNMIFIFFSNRVYPDRAHRQLYEHSLRPRMHQAVYDSIEKKEG